MKTMVIKCRCGCGSSVSLSKDSRHDKAIAFLNMKSGNMVGLRLDQAKKLRDGLDKAIAEISKDKK